LPSLIGHGEPNLAEGVVVRPQVEPTLSAVEARSGSGKVSLRGLFKRKIPQFSEKRYQNGDWKAGKTGGGGRVVIDEEQLAGIEIAASATEQRLASVMSKIGRVDPKDQVACRGLLEDLKEDVREALDDNDLGVLRGSAKLQADLDEMCKALIRQELLGKRRAQR